MSSTDPSECNDSAIAEPGSYKYKLHLRKGEFADYNIEKVEDIRSAFFIGDFARDDRWTAVFYHPNPDLSKGHSHFFGISREKVWSGNRLILTGEVVISDAAWVFDRSWSAIHKNDSYADVYISCGAHDFRDTPFGAVDGGSYYSRGVGISSNADLSMLQLDGIKLGEHRMKQKAECMPISNTIESDDIMIKETV